MQLMIVTVIVVAAAFFLIRRFYNSVRKKSSSTCGCSCDGCAPSRNDTRCEIDRSSHDCHM
jgi:hypothetical protein